MDDLSSLDRLRRDLRRRGLPTPYVERLIDELNDHRADLVDAETRRGLALHRAEGRAQDRLGAVDQLTNTIVSQYQARTFLGRHPVLTFLVVPFIATILGWALCFGVGIEFLAQLRQTQRGFMPLGGWEPLFLAVNRFCLWVPPLFATVVAYPLARRTARGLPWFLATCVVTALLAATFDSQLTYSPVPGRSRLTLGFGTDLHLLPMLVPCAIGGYYAWRHRSSWRLAMS